MLKSSGAMAAATLLSRVLGMVRMMVYGAFMGDGLVASAFAFAFTIPNLFRRLLGEGALTAAFVPIFKEKQKREGDVATWRAANAVLSALAALAVALTALAMLGLTAALLTGAFTGDKELMLRLLRLMFPYMIFACLTAVLMGMANARGHFFLPALGPALLNVVMIASVLLLAPRMGATLEQQIFALALGVLVAGAVQFAIQLPLLHRDGFRFRWVTPWRDETVRRVARQMLPATVGVAAFQINVVLTQTLALWYGTENAPIVASFDYAVRLMELPQGVFGISLATYLLPTLAGLAAEKNYAAFRATLRQGLGYLCFVNLLAAVLLAVLAEPIVRLLFERGEFSAAATLRAAWALQFLAPGLLAFSVVNVLARAFYALGDTHTPMRISLFCLTANLLLAFALIHPMRQGGLGLANTLTALLNVGLLGFALRKKLARLELAALRTPFLKMLAATALAGVVAWLAYGAWLSRFGHATLLLRLGEVFVPMLLATGIYLALTTALKVEQARDVFAALLRRRPVK